MARYAALEGDISAWTVSRSALFNGREKTPAAGDALTQLLATMAVGEFKLLNNTSFNLLTSPGTDVYTRSYYDAEYISSGGVSSNFASDAAVKTYVMGSYTTDDQGRPLYAGIAYKTATHTIIQFGGGHSNGAMNHGISFDVSAAAQSKLIGGSGGRWALYTDPAPLSTVDTNNDQAERDPAWPAVVKGSTFDLRFPQTIKTGTLGPNNNVAPYSLHTYSALAWDAARSRVWVGGGSVGNTGEGAVAPQGMWFVNDTTRAVTLKTDGHLGSNAPAYLMPPDGSSQYLMYSHGTNDQFWRAYDISAGTTSLTANDTGETTPPGIGANAMWVKGLTQTGYYDIIRQCTSGNNRRWMIYRKQWSEASGVATASQSSVLYPSASPYYSGAAATFNDASGFAYVEAERKIYAFGMKSADTFTGMSIQTIDPFGGDANQSAIWVVSNWLGGTYTGDVPTGPYSANHEMRTGWNNKVIDLGPTYKAFVLFSNPARGDVHLVKYGAV